MNRLNMLPENQLADILASLDRNIRDLKTGQVMASSGLVFYESASSGDWDFNQVANVVGGQQQASGVPFVITATAKKDKTFLLADLIIDKVLINSAVPVRVDMVPISSDLRHVRRWFVYVFVSKGLTSVLAQMKCAVVANTDVDLTVESRML
jgi:hypothetical protein|nr:MAG TPA: hypothetical protein [Caudoviricetes sp.]